MEIARALHASLFCASDARPRDGQYAVIQAMAPHADGAHSDRPSDVADMERRITAFATVPNGGMIATVGGIATHRAAIIAAANRNTYGDLSLPLLRR